MKQQGQARVGRIIYNKGKRVYPSYEGYTLVEVMTKSSKYGSLSPYELRDDKGRIMENIWQFSKLYEEVPYSKQRYSRWDSTVIWEYPAAKFVDYDKDGTPSLLPSYFDWRNKGMYCKYAVRYPTGRNHRHKCLCLLKEEPNGTINPKGLNYVDSRKEVYLPLYSKLVRSKPQFLELKERLQNGENLLIAEVDGPHQESLQYYMDTYGVHQDFIQNSTVLCTKENMDILLEDTKHPFGHGYCLGMTLLDLV